MVRRPMPSPRTMGGPCVRPRPRAGSLPSGPTTRPLSGIAQYRLKMDREALDTLSQSGRDHASVWETDPAGLAFLAMAHYRLGRKDEAQANLGRLRALLAHPARGGRDEADAFGARPSG